MPKADELDEILRISTNVAVLIDSERETEGCALNRDREEFLALCAQRELKAHALDRRAIENYFPDTAVKQIFGENYRGLGAYEKLTNVSPHWSKSQNWKLAAQMTFEDIAETDLGRFLKEI